MVEAYGRHNREYKMVGRHDWIIFMFQYLSWRCETNQICTSEDWRFNERLNNCPFQRP